MRPISLSENFLFEIRTSKYGRKRIERSGYDQIRVADGDFITGVQLYVFIGRNAPPVQKRSVRAVFVFQKIRVLDLLDQRVMTARQFIIDDDVVFRRAPDRYFGNQFDLIIIEHQIRNFIGVRQHLKPLTDFARRDYRIILHELHYIFKRRIRQTRAECRCVMAAASASAA